MNTTIKGIYVQPYILFIYNYNFVFSNFLTLISGRKSQLIRTRSFLPGSFLFLHIKSTTLLPHLFGI